MQNGNILRNGFWSPWTDTRSFLNLPILLFFMFQFEKQFPSSLTYLSQQESSFYLKSTCHFKLEKTKKQVRISDFPQTEDFLLVSSLQKLTHVHRNDGSRIGLPSLVVSFIVFMVNTKKIDSRQPKSRSKKAWQWNKMGQRELSQLRIQTASDCFDKAIQEDPNYSNAWNNKSLVLKRQVDLR